LTLYAESSAVLAWLLGDPRAGAVRDVLASAEAVVASDLTLIECERVVIRASTLGELSEAEASSRRASLAAAASHWTTLRLGTDVVDRARRRFPHEPVRTFDALHLASALTAKAAIADLGFLSLESLCARTRASWVSTFCRSACKKDSLAHCPFFV